MKLWDGEKEVEVKDKARVIDVLKTIGINPETVLVKKGDEVIVEDEVLKENDEIELIKVVSGG